MAIRNILVAIWYFSGHLVCCTNKNLATLQFDDHFSSSEFGGNELCSRVCLPTCSAYQASSTRNVVQPGRHDFGF
jgi:hypothetical protein